MSLHSHVRFSLHAALALAAIVSVALLVVIAQIGSAEEDEGVGEVSLQFYAAPLQLVKGEKARLDWESEGAEYCTASGLWSGKQGTSGSLEIKATKTGNYQLQCFDSEGVGTEKITRKVTVVTTKKKLKRAKLVKPTPILFAPVTAGNDQDVTISWAGPKGIVACRASGPEDWEGLKPPNGEEKISAEIGKEYDLVCWNENGAREKTAHTFKQKQHRYTASDAKLSADYLPLWPDDFTLSDGRVVYFIDFLRKVENEEDTTEDDDFYFGSRIVIDPETNLRLTTPAILKQLWALPSQVPPDVDPKTKRVTVTEPISYSQTPGSPGASYNYAFQDLNRFVNDGEYSNNGEIPMLSPEQIRARAVDATLEYLELPRDETYRAFYVPSDHVIWFNGVVAGVPMFFVVDVYNPEKELIRRVVLDPYTGDDVTDKEIFENYAIWERTVLTEREKVAFPPELGPDLIPDYGEPVSNPPTQEGVVPPEEPKKEEPKQTTQCQTGWAYSPTLGRCYETTPAPEETSKPSCAPGTTYSFTFKRCMND